MRRKLMCGYLDLPCELCNDQFLWRVGALVGTMLRVDRNTSIHSSGKFVRICVEIDLQRELLPAFTVLGSKFKLEYEGLHLICFSYGKYGHKKEVCPALIHVSDDGHGTVDVGSHSLEKERKSYGRESRESSANNPNNLTSRDVNGAPIRADDESCFGPWILARENFRKKGPLANNQGNDLSSRSRETSIKDRMVLPESGGSRYQALYDTDMHVLHDKNDVVISEETHTAPSLAADTSRSTVHLKLRTKGSQHVQGLNKHKYSQRHVSFKSPTGVNLAASSNPATDPFGKKDRDFNELEMMKNSRGDQLAIIGQNCQIVLTNF